MKTNNQVRTIALFGLALAIALTGCGKKSDGANINVQFSNHTVSAQVSEYEAVGPRGLMKALSLQSSQLVGVTPTIFQMKLVAFYMVEAIDAATGDNKGAGVHIWKNKNCDSDLTYCGINPETANGHLADYFDFARGSDVVNAEFNSYKRETKDDQIGPGTYNYIRMDFSGKYTDGDTIPNLKFGTTVAHEVRAQNGGVLVALPKPLVIEQGDTFTVDLAYSLDNAYYESSTNYPVPAEVGTRGWNCEGEGSNIPCIAEVEFAPTVTKK